jgi:hypothetical protein
MQQQQDLFEPLLAAYRSVQVQEGGIVNAELYQTLELGNERKPAGLACSTILGAAIWTRTEALAGQLTEQISAIVTSPPYPLRTPRLSERCPFGLSR